MQTRQRVARIGPLSNVWKEPRQCGRAPPPASAGVEHPTHPHPHPHQAAGPAAPHPLTGLVLLRPHGHKFVQVVAPARAECRNTHI